MSRNLRGRLDRLERAVPAAEAICWDNLHRPLDDLIPDGVDWTALIRRPERTGADDIEDLIRAAGKPTVDGCPYRS